MSLMSPADLALRVSVLLLLLLLLLILLTSSSFSSLLIVQSEGADDEDDEEDDSGEGVVGGGIFSSLPHLSPRFRRPSSEPRPLCTTDRQNRQIYKYDLKKTIKL
jgi:hypothetical protein